MIRKVQYQLHHFFWRSSLPKIIFWSRFLTRIYYTLFSDAFSREMQGVGYGILKHNRELSRQRTSIYLLRRNIHRLEKGLLMRPRRPIFGLAYIDDTVEAYLNLFDLDCKDVSNETIKWFHDVLDAYFGAIKIGEDILVDEAREKFYTTEKYVTSSGNSKSSPYSRSEIVKSDVCFKEFKKLCVQRRSVRWYIDKPVPRELVDQALECATLAPSACNRQPFHYKIFDDPKLISTVSALPMGTSGFNHNFTMMIAIIGEQSAYDHERDRHVIYIDASLSAMSLMLALETIGLSSCPINWPDVEHLESKLSKLINLSPDQRVIMFMSIGFPDPTGLIAYSQKKTIDELRSYNL